jgi:hypothetical protein
MILAGRGPDSLPVDIRTIETVGQDDNADFLFLERDRKITEDAPVTPMPKALPVAFCSMPQPNPHEMLGVTETCGFNISSSIPLER